jgi:hypothetical protein
VHDRVSGYPCVGAMSKLLAGGRSPGTGPSAIVPAMEQGKVADPVTLLAGLRERVRVLEERIAGLGRHL